MTVRRFLLASAAAILFALSGCVSVPNAPEGAKVETIFIDHKDAAGTPIKLEVVLYLPPGSGPFDVALHNHGSHTAGNSSDVRKGEEVAGPFLKRGVAVVALIRQGRGKSGGQVSNLNCNPTNALRGFEQDYGDVVQGLRFISASPLFAGKKIYTYGHSRGGVLSAALAMREPGMIAGAVGFGTGWQAIGIPGSCSTGQTIQNGVFERLASATAAPTLFMYAQNDTYIPPPSVVESFDRYKNKGGTGVLKTYPPVTTRFGDGHLMIYRTDVWEEDVMRFLNLNK